MALGADANVGDDDCAEEANLEDDGVVVAGAGEGEGESDADSEQDAAVAAQEEDVLKSFAQESSNLADATVQDEAAVVAPGLNEAQSEELERSTRLLEVLEDSRKQLMDVGAVHAAGQLEVEIRKEKHRMREVSREDPDVLLGLARIRDTRAEEERKRRLAIEDANRQVMTRQKLRREIKDAETLLQKRKQQVAEQEQIAEARHVVNKIPIGLPWGWRVRLRRRIRTQAP